MNTEVSLPSNTPSLGHTGRLLCLAFLSLATVSCIVEERGVVYQRYPAHYHHPVVAPVYRPTYQTTYQPAYPQVYQAGYSQVYQPGYRPSYQPAYRPPHSAYPRYTQPAYVEERVYPSLPFGASVTYVRGQRCWYHNGSYYRHHPRGTGFVIFVP